MRKNLLMLAMLALVAAGCSKEKKDSTTPSNNPPTTSFTAKLNGTAVTGLTTTLVKQTNGTGGTALSMAASFNHDNLTASLGFFVTEYTGVKKYEDITLLLGYSDTAKSKTGLNGIVEITKDDGTYVTGTLNGTVYKDITTGDSIVITEGAFTMKY